MPLLQVLSQSQDVSSAQLTGRGGTCVGQHRRLPAAQVCVKPDLCIDWILQAVIKRNTSQDQRLNEYLDISSIYTFIHIHIYIYTHYLYLMFLGFFQPQGFNSATILLHAKKTQVFLGGPLPQRGTPIGAVDMAAAGEIYVMTGNSKREHRVSVHLRQRLACDFSVGKYGFYTLSKKQLGPWMSWENMNYMIILKLCWCFMFLILPDGCPALTEEGTKEAALDPLMICACPWVHGALAWTGEANAWGKRVGQWTGPLWRCMPVYAIDFFVQFCATMIFCFERWFAFVVGITYWDTL